MKFGIFTLIARARGPHPRGCTGYKKKNQLEKNISSSRAEAAAVAEAERSCKKNSSFQRLQPKRITRRETSKRERESEQRERENRSSQSMERRSSLSVLVWNEGRQRERGRERESGLSCRMFAKVAQVKYFPLFLVLAEVCPS